jgi:hypothetical protein
MLVQAFARFYAALRKNPMYREATILFVFENNLGNDQDFLNLIIKENVAHFQNTFVLREHKELLGFRSTDKNKIDADENLRNIVTEGGLAIAQNFVSVNTDPSRRGENAIKMLFQQLEYMQEYWICDPNLREPRHKITSRFTADGKEHRSRHDDIQRALSMSLNVHRMYLSRRLPAEDYKAIARLQPNRQTTAIGLQTIAAAPAARKRARAYDDDIDL